MAEVLTKRPPKLAEVMTPELGIVATHSVSRPGGYKLLYDTPKRPGGNDKGHGGDHVA
jgi:hypothetical protein